MITAHELCKARTWVIIIMVHHPDRNHAAPYTAQVLTLQLAAQEYSACIGPDCCMPAVQVAHQDDDACNFVTCNFVTCNFVTCNFVTCKALQLLACSAPVCCLFLCVPHARGLRRYPCPPTGCPFEGRGLAAFSIRAEHVIQQLMAACRSCRVSYNYNYNYSCVCSVLGGTARAHRIPASNGQDLIVSRVLHR